MKELETVKISAYVDKTLSAGKLRTMKCNELVKKMWPSIKNLESGQGKIMDITEEGDEKWPTLEEYKKDKRHPHLRIVNRSKPFINELKRTVNIETKYKQCLMWNYIGDGKIIIWIAMKKIKIKKPDVVNDV